MSQNKTNLAQRTADTLRAQIRSGEDYAPGRRCPTKPSLTEAGVSRTTLREAIRILVAEGLLQVQRGKGTFVTERKDQLADTLPSFDEKKVTLKDLYEARLIIEPAAAALACQRATDEEIEEIVRSESHPGTVHP